MLKPVEAVRLAMNALTASAPAERRQRFDELLTAKDELAALVGEYEQWLGNEDIYLRDHPEIPDYQARDERWMRREVIYKEAFNVLQDALLLEKYLTMGRPTGRQMAMDEAPF